MPAGSTSRIWLPIALSVLALPWVVAGASLGAAPAAVDKPAVDRPAAGELPPRREVPDDPPGVPARPVPGTPASLPVTCGRFTANQVNVDTAGANIPGDAANEPSIAVNPLTPNQMAIGWRQFDTISSNFREAGWSYSTDGGRTWTFRGVLEPDVFRSDPVLSFDATGTFYYASLTIDWEVDVWRSLDNGISWLPPVPAWGGDKEWITVDRTDGAGAGHIYETWSISGAGPETFTRSTDGGQSFGTPVAPPNNPVWGTMDVAPDGTLYLAGVDWRDPAIFYVDRSADAQFPGATPTFEATIVDLGGRLPAFGGNGTPNPTGLLGQVWIAADPSTGPTAGYVYLLCSVDPEGDDPLDVHLSRSTDGGVTWSPPIRVNDDPSDPNAWQWFGTMSVAPNGRIDVVWNDTRETGTPNISALYYAYSTDGGLNWSPNECISQPFDSHIGFPNQGKIGDYYCMISDAVGAHVAWAATFNGEQDIYYTRIGDYDCNVNGVPDTIDIALGTSPDQNGNGIPDECEQPTTALADRSARGGTTGDAVPVRLHQNAPNPFNPATTIRFDLPPEGAPVWLRIYAADGRLVRALLHGAVLAGTREVRWDGRDEKGRTAGSGLYYYRLETEGFTEARAMILLR